MKVVGVTMLYLKVMEFQRATRTLVTETEWNDMRMTEWVVVMYDDGISHI